MTAFLQSGLLATKYRSSGSGYPDGYSGAPAATIQYPTMLSSYPARPPWKVAGVDYAVGYPSSTTLTAWQLMSGTGITVNSGLSPPQVRIEGVSNGTINGIDFSDTSPSGGNGAYLYITNCTNLTVKNCKFGGSNLRTVPAGVVHLDVSSTGLTVTNCIIDGGASGGADTQACLLFCYGGGNLTFTYNWLKNYPQQVIEDLNSATLVMKFNLIDNCRVATGAHMNWHQLSNGTVNTNLTFNCCRQTLTGGAEGFQFYFNGTGSLVTPVCSNNTIVVPNAGSMSYIMHGDGGSLSGVGTFNANYFDSRGSFGPYYAGSFSSGWVISGNIDMNTGAPENYSGSGTGQQLDTNFVLGTSTLA